MKPEIPGIVNVITRHRAHLERKPDPRATGRLAEAKRLTGLLQTPGGFSFGRIGDYDLGFLLNPEEAAAEFDTARTRISGTQGAGSPGLDPSWIGRLRSSLERISYLDFHELLWKDDSLLQQLGLKRPIGSFCNPSRNTSYILPTWLEHEFKVFCRGRRILFCGAEAPLLENLHKQEAFTEASKEFWPVECEVFFLRPREDGRNLSSNLDLIKADLISTITHNRIDTLFLSLGGGAKILCCELAGELNICAIDFGACMRSLTYSGSDGNLATRSTHLIFLYRLPFDLFMDAVESTYPDLDGEQLLAKAHAQLLLEVQEKETGWSHSAWENDFSPENKAYFKLGFVKYRHRYRKLFNISNIARKERADFLHFCGTHKLTREGRLFLTGFKIKSALARIIGK